MFVDHLLNDFVKMVGKARADESEHDFCLNDIKCDFPKKRNLMCFNNIIFAAAFCLLNFCTPDKTFFKVLFSVLF